MPNLSTDEWFVIINPAAGQGKAKKLWPKIHEALRIENIPFSFEFTASQGNAFKLIELAVIRGYRSFISVGGDGTVNELINGLYRQSHCDPSGCIVGHIAAGTGNDWGKSAGIPTDFKQVLKMIKMHVYIDHDVGRIRYPEHAHEEKTDYFINVAGAGFDSYVAHKTNCIKAKYKIGKISYLTQLFLCLVQYKHPSMSIKLDSKKIKEDIFSISIGIGKYNGSGMMQLPEARIDDGLFDVTIIKKMPKLRVIQNIPKVYDGTFVRSPFVEQHRCEEITIDCDPQVYIEMDGNIGGTSPFVLDILPRKIRVVGGKY